MKSAVRFLFLAIVLFPSHREVFACSCLPNPPPPEGLKEAGAVFRGITLSEDPAEPRLIRVAFSVRTVWKGPTVPLLDVLTADSSAACRVSFELGGGFIVYAFEDGQGALKTFLCSRTGGYRAQEAAELGPPIRDQTGETAFHRGEATADGQLDLADAVFTLGYLFLGEAQPTCLKAADANGDGSLDVSDPIGPPSYLFSGGIPPPPAFPSCGFDPTGDGLT